MASPDPVPAEPDTGSPASAATPTIAAGAVSVVVGVLVLRVADISIVVLAWLFGVQLILAGVLQLVAAFWRNDGAAARVLLDWPVPSRSSSGCSACAGRCRQRCCSGCSSGRRGSSPASSASCTRSVRGMATAADGASLPGS